MDGLAIATQCSACGSTLSQEGRSAGLCPGCLFELALESPSVQAEIEILFPEPTAVEPEKLTSKAGVRAGHKRIEIVHESLLKSWPRLVRWQMQDAEGVKLRDELRAQAHLWDEHGRSEDYFWTGTAYLDYLAWRARYPGRLSASEEDFARAMTVHAERRRRRRRIATTVAFAVLLVGLAVIAGFWRRSVAQTRRAEAAQLLARGQERFEDDPTEALAFTTASLELADSQEARLFAQRVLWAAPMAREVDLGDMGAWSQWFSPEGNRLSAAGTSDKVRVWESEGGPPVVLADHEMEGTNTVRGVWASEELLVTGHLMGQEQRIWRFPGGQGTKTIDLGGPAWSQVGESRLLAGLMDEDAESGHEIFSFRSWQLPDGDYEDLGSIDWSPVGASDGWFDPDGSGLVYLKENKVFYKALPLREDAPARLVGSHENDAYFVGIPRVPDRAWTRDAVTGELRLWDLAASSTDPLEILTPPDDLGPDAVAIPSRNGEWLRDWFQGGRPPRVWDLKSWPEARPLTLRRSGSWFASKSRFHPKGTWLAVGTHGRTRVTMWPLTLALPRTVDGYSNRYVRPLEFSRDSRWLASFWPDNSVRLWPLPLSGERQVRTLPLPSDTMGSLWWSLVFEPNGRFLFIVDYTNLAYIVPLDGSPPRQLEGLPPCCDTFLSDAAVSPSGRRVATALRNAIGGKGQRNLWLWEVETGELQVYDLPDSVTPEPDTDSGVWDLAFADESTLYTSGDGGIRRWDLDSGDHDLFLSTQKGSYRTSAAFGPKAETAFVMEPMPGDALLGVARILDTETGEVREISSFAESVLRSPTLWPRDAFDATGTMAVTGDSNGTIRVASLAGGEANLLLGHEGTIDSVAVSPDGRWVASTGEDNTLRLWPMPDLDKPPLHTLPRDELIAKLKSLTNIRVVRDPEAAEGWSVTLDPFPGWKEVPTW